MATPILDAIRRCGSRVEFSATTENVTSPGYKYFRPSLREINLQLGGKMEETRTRFCAAMPASRSANSKEVSRSLCLPTPLVRKIRLGTSSLPKLMSSGGARFWNESQNVAHGEGFVIQELFRSENNLPRLAPDICRFADAGFYQCRIIGRIYFAAAADSTFMESPLTTPVTIAFSPARLTRSSVFPSSL